MKIVSRQFHSKVLSSKIQKIRLFTWSVPRQFHSKVLSSKIQKIRPFTWGVPERIRLKFPEFWRILCDVLCLYC